MLLLGVGPKILKIHYAPAGGVGMDNSYLSIYIAPQIYMAAVFAPGVHICIRFVFSYIAAHTSTIASLFLLGAGMGNLHPSFGNIPQICTTSSFPQQGAKKDIAHSFPNNSPHIYMLSLCRTYPDPGCAAQSQHGTCDCYSWLLMSCYNQCCGEEQAQRRRWRVWGRGTYHLLTTLRVLA